MKNKMVFVIILLSLGTFCLFLYGFISGVQAVLHPSGEHIAKMNVDEAVKTTSKSGNNIVALGDSLTRGVGDEKGIGYVGRFKNKLEKETKEKVVLTNLAVSGAETKDLLKQLEQEGIQYTIKKADTIVLTIGGNDLFPGAEKLVDLDLMTYKTNIKQFQKAAVSIIENIRSLNPNSPIFWLGLYNPFEDVEQLQGSSALVAQWNNELQKISLTYKDVYIIPTFDLFQGKGKSLLYTDHFHPNGEGYRLMANRLAEKVISQSQIEVSE